MTDSASTGKGLRGKTERFAEILRGLMQEGVTLERPSISGQLSTSYGTARSEAETPSMRLSAEWLEGFVRRPCHFRVPQRSSWREAALEDESWDS